jgi:hypothetical protein
MTIAHWFMQLYVRQRTDRNCLSDYSALELSTQRAQREVSCCEARFSVQENAQTVLFEAKQSEGESTCKMRPTNSLTR